MTTLPDALAVAAEMRELLADEMRWHYDKTQVGAWADRLEALAQPGAVGEEVCCGNYNYNGDCCYRKVPAPHPPATGLSADALTLEMLRNYRDELRERGSDCYSDAVQAQVEALELRRLASGPAAKSQGVDDATIRAAIKAMKLCAGESNAAGWKPHILAMESAIAHKGKSK